MPNLSGGRFSDLEGDKIISLICNDEIRGGEQKTALIELLSRHIDALEFAFWRIHSSERHDPLWRKATRNLQLNSPTDLLEEATDYLLHAPQKGENEGIRRICTYEQNKPLSPWLKTTLRYLAYDMRRNIIAEKKRLQVQDDIEDDKEDEEAVFENKIFDINVDVIIKVGRILEEMDSECDSLLTKIFFSGTSIANIIADSHKSSSIIRAVESCLLKFSDKAQGRGNTLQGLGVSLGRPEKLWKCITQLQDPCRLLLIDRCFLGLTYRRIGSLHSNKKLEDYEKEDRDKEEVKEAYERAKYDWARNRITGTCKREAEKACSIDISKYI